MIMNYDLYNNGYNIVTNMISKIDNDDENVSISMVKVLTTLNDMQSNLDLFAGARAAFAQPQFHVKNIHMLLSAPISTIPKLRIFGFTETMISLMMDPTVYHIVNCSSIPFETIFKCDDHGMVKRALIGYIMDIPYDVFPKSDKFYDLKVKVWNNCLELAKNLKDTYSIFANVSYEELTQVIIDCSYGDAIGNDEHGDEEFFNKFIRVSFLDIREIGGYQLHGYLLSKITEIGDKLLDEFEWTWMSSPQRLMLYLRLKMQLFKLNPNLEDRWYSRDL